VDKRREEGVARGQRKMVPQGGTHDGERPRLNHNFHGPVYKEVPSIQRAKRTQKCGGEGRSIGVVPVFGSRINGLSSSI